MNLGKTGFLSYLWQTEYLEYTYAQEANKGRFQKPSAFQVFLHPEYYRACNRDEDSGSTGPVREVRIEF